MLSNEWVDSKAKLYVKLAEKIESFSRNSKHHWQLERMLAMK